MNYETYLQEAKTALDNQNDVDFGYTMKLDFGSDKIIYIDDTGDECIVSNVKTIEKDGYNAVQLASIETNKDISKIKDRADRNNLIMRPHFKTHQSLEVGKWYKNQGIDRITVSSISMAKYFSKDWNDILIAFPVNILEIETLNNMGPALKDGKQILDTFKGYFGNEKDIGKAMQSFKV